MLTQTEIIRLYAAYRKLEEPDRREALLFLISEIGELAEAELEHFSDDNRGRAILLEAILLGRDADIVVSNMKSWTRNGERTKKTIIAREIADIEMMLNRYADLGGYVEPFECLLNKMSSYGFRPNPTDSTFTCPYCHHLNALTTQVYRACQCGRKYAIVSEDSGKTPTDQIVELIEDKEIKFWDQKGGKIEM